MEMIVLAQFIGVLALGALFGGLLGYYGKCTNGACLLTATPQRGALYGMVLAGLFGIPMLTNRAAVGSVAPEDSDVIHVQSTADFDQQVLQAGGTPVLVDFYSLTCGPCRRLSPTIEKLATQYKDRANVVKVNIDKVPELASRYNIYAIPAILIFSNGKEYKRITGYNSEKTYVVALDELLS